jgi:Protein of unknown function (DUF1236)
MRRHHLTSVAALALALGMTTACVTTAGAQNADQRRNTEQGKQTDQLESQRPQTSGQGQDVPAQQRSDQDDRRGAQNPPSTAGQNATGRQPDDRPSAQGPSQQQGAQQQNAPVTSRQSQQNAREPQQGQSQQQGAQAPQPNTPSNTGQNATDRQQGDRPEQRPNQPQQGAQQQNQQNGREPQREQSQQQGAQSPDSGRSRQGAQEPPQGGEKQQGAAVEQPDRSGRIALDEREQMHIGDIIRQQRIQPLTNLTFALSVGSTVPSSVRLSRISGELAEIFPHYRDFSFFVARQELVIVDSQSYGIVGFVPIAGGGTVGMAPPRGESGAVGTAAPPAPTKKKAERTEKKRVTITEEKPRAIERETIRRSPAHTETDVTVGISRRELDEPPPRDRHIGHPPVREHFEGPPVRERFERDEGPPFPFSLFLGRPN